MGAAGRGGKVGKNRRKSSRASRTGKSWRDGTQGKVRRSQGEALYPGVDYTGATRSGCPSGKWGWLERDGARTLAKALRKNGEKAVREYLCECGRWHAGHLPMVTRRGDLGADEWYGRA